MEKQRLDKIIASTGRFSRREVKDLIRHGRVWVDGAPACSAQDQVDPETAAITINGEPMLYRRFTWVMLNKPAGYLSATEDGRGPRCWICCHRSCGVRASFPWGAWIRIRRGCCF